MSNTGDDSHGNIRSDFPGGWAEDGDDVNGFVAIGLTEEARAFQAELRTLLNWRHTSNAVHEGSLKHYVPVAGSYVYFRESANQTIMVILNQGDASESLELARFDEVLQGRRGLVDALTGEELNSGETLDVPSWKAWVLEVQN